MRWRGKAGTPSTALRAQQVSLNSAWTELSQEVLLAGPDLLCWALTDGTILTERGDKAGTYGSPGGRQGWWQGQEEMPDSPNVEDLGSL